MGNRIELPSGGWVELKDGLDDIRGGARKKLLKEAGISNGGSDVDNGFAITAAVAHFAVERYQLAYQPFQDAIKINMLEVDWDELRVIDQDALIVALQPVIAQLLPSQPTPDNMKPGSPTPPAGG